jgi:AAA domain
MLSRLLHHRRRGRLAFQPATTGGFPPGGGGVALVAGGGAAAAALLPADTRRQALREAFTPMRPQRSLRRFVGRRAQFARILQAIEEDQAHVVLYAERGRGKTSLANLVADAARNADHMVARYACTAESDFDAIARGLARDLPRPLLGAPVVGEAGLQGCEAALPAGRLQPGDVTALPSRVMGRLLLVVDEFDRVQDEATRTRLADTIKMASDCGAPLSFLVVGVSDSLEQLLGRHPSIQRNVVGVPLPLLPDAEIDSLVERGGREVGLVFPPEARSCIASLARGGPYIAQLLALRAGQAALARQATEVSPRDLRAAIQRVVEEADPRVVALHETLTAGGRAPEMTAMLRGIAAGTQNGFGQFLVETLPEGGLRVAGVGADPVLWSRLLDAGAVRACVGAGSNVFTFEEAALGPYILLRAARDGVEDGAASEPAHS